MSEQDQQPYLVTRREIVERAYNPDFGDDRECECGHPYHRHFDDNTPIGCKYCACRTFRLPRPEDDDYDLLEQAKLTLEYLDEIRETWGDEGVLRRRADGLRAAIAKAEGGSPL